MCRKDSCIILQIKDINLNSSSDFSDFVEVSSDWSSCRTKASPLCRPCVCLYATNCGPEQRSRRGLAVINSDSEPSKAPNLSLQRAPNSLYLVL